MPKIDGALFYTRKLRGNAFKGDILWHFFQQSSMICIGRHVGGHLAVQHGGQNYFFLLSC